MDTATDDTKSAIKPPPTQEYVLRAMAANYATGSLWDHLDTEACLKAADEIKFHKERGARLEKALNALMVTLLGSKT